MDIHINYVAILLTVIATFIFGFIWYTPLFGKVWARELGIQRDRKPTSAELGKGLGLNIIGNFLLAFVLAHNNAAWSFVPGIADMPTAAVISNAAVFTWLGFFVPVDLNRVAWEGRSWKLFFINTGYHLITLFIAATILTLMK
jgi:Protein of unknown function (DUF1761)